MGASELVMPFVGALQATLAVLITIFWGVLAAQFNLLSQQSAKEISRTCVRIFLPALLIYKLGSELHRDTGMDYIPIIIWALIYNVVSISLGMVTTRMFKLPEWVTMALTFNNTTSLPLLLIKSLKSTGLLEPILRDENDTVSSAIDRATSYFLVNAMISNTLTFALGPKILKPSEEDAPDNHQGNKDNGGEDRQAQDDEENQDEEEGGHIDERSSLLPRHAVNGINHVHDVGSIKGRKYWEKIPPWGQSTLDFLYAFVNAPLLGAVVGAIIGLTPSLHRLFFNDTTEGGYFNAWLMTAVQNIGDLFAVTQIIVVGVKLSLSLRKMKNGEDSGKVPWYCVLYITAVRFIIWPAISIPIIYFLAAKTSILGADPTLWFAMMIMPTGPPAMLLMAFAEVNGSQEDEKSAIAKLLTVSYAITPIICFTIVGGLKATQAAFSQ